MRKQAQYQTIKLLTGRIISDDLNALRDLSSLNQEEQTAIRIEYGYYLDSLPPTCLLGTRIDQFRTWLRDVKAIDYHEKQLL